MAKMLNLKAYDEVSMRTAEGMKWVKQYLSDHAVAEHFWELQIDCERTDLYYKSLFDDDNCIGIDLVNNIVRHVYFGSDDLPYGRGFQKIWNHRKQDYDFVYRAYVQLVEKHSVVDTGTRYTIDCGDVVDERRCQFIELVFKRYDNVIEPTTAFPVVKPDYSRPFWSISLQRDNDGEFMIVG